MFPTGFLCVLWLCILFTMSSQTNDAKVFVGVLTGDDNLTVFADGVHVGENAQWYLAKWFSFSCKTKLIAVSVTNIQGGKGGFLGIFSNGVVTDASWKCKETDRPENGWEQANFTDDAWPYAYMRNNNSVTKLWGIPTYVRWISPANHYATRFICRRRFSIEERKRNRTTGLELINYGDVQTFTTMAGSSAYTMTLLGQRPMFLAVSGGYPFIALDAKWIEYSVTTSNKIYCRQSINADPVPLNPNCTPSAGPETAFTSLVPQVTVFSTNSIDSSTIAMKPSSATTHTTKTASIAPSKNVSNAPRASRKTDPDGMDANRLSTENDIKALQQRKQGSDKWEIKSDDVTVCEELGHGAFGKVFKGIMNTPSYTKHGSSVQKTSKKKAKSSITVAVKMLEGVLEFDVRIIWKEARGRKDMDSALLFTVTLKQKLHHFIHCNTGSCVRYVKNTHLAKFLPTTWQTGVPVAIVQTIVLSRENATPDQRQDFLEEINLMKAVGSHKNIVSLIGCCIKSSPNFLVVEFASQGDLLSYLRELRKKVQDTKTEYVQVRERPPQTSTRSNLERPDSQDLGINDIGKVNVAFSNRDSSIDIRINSTQFLNDEQEEQQDSLSSQDVMSISWQIAQGMFFLERIKVRARLDVIGKEIPR
ncbi:hypothetical protein ACROYT_G009300 [Oculina patagonica]